MTVLEFFTSFTVSFFFLVGQENFETDAVWAVKNSWNFFSYPVSVHFLVIQSGSGHVSISEFSFDILHAIKLRKLCCHRLLMHRF